MAASATLAPAQGISRPQAMAYGLIVSVFWASSFVLIKAGLEQVGPLTLAGLRYSVAFACLLPWLFLRRYRPAQRLSGRDWLGLAGMGLAAYPIATGALFIGLQSISATTSSFLFSFSPVLVLLIGMVLLREFPSLGQGLGMVLILLGTYVFFAVALAGDQPVGLAITVLSAVAFALFSVMARSFTRAGRVGTLWLTALPLGIGGLSLLVVALLIEGGPRLDWKVVGLVFWLATLNTVLCYLLWNQALRRLKAFELNIMLNAMPLETALMAWIVVGEPLTVNKLAGMLLVVIGILIVQNGPRLPWRKAPPSLP